MNNDNGRFWSNAQHELKRQDSTYDISYPNTNSNLSAQPIYIPIPVKEMERSKTHDIYFFLLSSMGLCLHDFLGIHDFLSNAMLITKIRVFV